MSLKKLHVEEIELQKDLCSNFPRALSTTLNSNAIENFKYHNYHHRSPSLSSASNSNDSIMSLPSIHQRQQECNNGSDHSINTFIGKQANFSKVRLTPLKRFGLI